MDWANERFVRFYTRDTVEWLALSWKAQGLFGLILRKCDRAGVIELGRLGPRGLAALLHAPWAEIESPLGELLTDGCVEIRADDRPVLVVPNYLEAQEATSSDKQRQRDSRERRRDKARSEDVTKRDATGSQNVTETSQPVTACHSEPSPSDPAELEEEESSAADASQPPPQLELVGDTPRPKRRKTNDDIATAWKLWRERYDLFEGRPYVNGDACGRAIKRLASTIRGHARDRAIAAGGDEQALFEAALDHVMRAYLGDKGSKNFLELNAHQLQYINRDVPRYALPWTPGARRPPPLPRKAEPPTRDPTTDAPCGKPIGSLVADIGRTF